jgi:hypothetical protein
VAVGLLCAWWGPSGPLIGNDFLAENARRAFRLEG